MMDHNQHALPLLREELILHPGPTTSQGAPTWSLHDPIRNLFFRIDWLTYEILSRWGMNDPQVILSAIEQETTIHPEEEDLIMVIHFLMENELIQRHGREGSTWYWQQSRLRRITWWNWLIHHYLFFRVPLWRPDNWLGRFLPWVNIFYTRLFLVFTLLALFFGLIEISRQWEKFFATLVDYFSWEGMFKYALALVFVKFLHELGHALTAKRHGCRVPTMGIAFLVMFPMAYTDVNEAWKLRERHQRLAVGSAGILVELAIAAWSTLAWTLLPQGHLRDATFLLATTTWISTMAINISPFMRFDGYFLIMDWLDMPNLHARIFALARWWLRERLFGLGDQPPEFLPRGRYYGLLLFAFIIWFYRLIIFTSIAIMVYFWFPKPLGPLLAAVEISWFIILPIISELKNWQARIGKIIKSSRTWWMITVLGLIMAFAFIPWDRRIHSQGLLRPTEHAIVVSPGAARIQSLLVTDGAQVVAREKLMILEAETLAFQKKALAARAVSLRWRAVTASVDTKLRERQKILQEEANKADMELAGIVAEQTRYTPRAPFAGHFFLVSPDLQRDDWIGKNNILGVVTDTSKWMVETYLPEDDLNRIQVGDGGRFYSETPGVAVLPIQVEHIDHDAVHDLPDGILASTRGGGLLARESQERIVPEIALYRVTLKLTAAYSPDRAQILRGRIVLFGAPKAIMDVFIQTATALLIRESSF
ncbi:putative peptide zinc metalloprotease protein [Gammaproteobacteria bacterium]